MLFVDYPVFKGEIAITLLYYLQYFGAPVAYIQQIIVRTSITPWQSNKLIPSDSYRSSLSTVFELLEHIDNYQQRNGLVFCLMNRLT